MQCLAKADRATGKLRDGAKQEFRCFAASAEAMYPSVRKSRWDNFELLRGKTSQEMAQMILESLPGRATMIRVHVSGDFFNDAYFKAWMKVANVRAEVTFYGYTKSIKTWAENWEMVPSNFKLTASFGGMHDELIKRYGLKYSQVVFSVEQAEKLGLAIDHDDSLAYGSSASFALLLHGTQAKGTLAAKSLSALKAQGFKGYSSKKVRGEVK